MSTTIILFFYLFKLNVNKKKKKLNYGGALSLGHSTRGELHLQT